VNLSKLFLLGVVLSGAVLRVAASTADAGSQSDIDFTLAHESDGMADAKDRAPARFSVSEIIVFSLAMAGIGGAVSLGAKKT
jgi:hypothetical protein